MKKIYVDKLAVVFHYHVLHSTGELQFDTSFSVKYFDRFGHL